MIHTKKLAEHILRVPSEEPSYARRVYYARNTTCFQNPVKFNLAFSKLREERTKPIMLGLEYEVSRKAKAPAVLPELTKSVELLNYANFRSEEFAYFEMVSVPATCKLHKKYLEEYFFSNEAVDNLKATNKNGVHIHVDKKAFKTETAMARFVMFINEPKNREFINEIAGREPNTYCERKPYRGTTKKFNYKTTHRFLATAVRGSTLEVRLFASTTCKKTLFARIEFCEALVVFCNKTTSDRSCKNVNVFKRFVKLNAKRWPYLAASKCISN